MVFSKFIPKAGLELVKYRGDEFVDKIGLDIVRNVVYSILCGKNVRDLTESLTQRRVLFMNAAVFIAYLRALASRKTLERNLSAALAKELDSRITSEQRSFLFWFLGLTGKSLQNVARDDKGLERYLDEFDSNLKSIASDVQKEFGELRLTAFFEGNEAELRWPNLLRCLLAVGAQTLTVRGSEKSMYGKVFEKLVLGTVLSSLGFTFIDRNETACSTRVFWLSERGDKRESDATALIKPGLGIRFDIGFIGRGNSEVSLDKVTRFGNQMRRGGQVHQTITIILIDSLYSGSRIVPMTHELGAELLQMSEYYWVHELALILRNRLNYKSKLSTLTEVESLSYLRDRLNRIDLSPFLSSRTAKGE